MNSRQASAKIIAHSRGPHGQEIVTYQLRYWRSIHSEVLTHRVLCRNASSSRAVPVKKSLEEIRTNPAGPLKFMKNKAGMQATEDFLPEEHEVIEMLWNTAAKNAALVAEEMMRLGVHKQYVNRLLEPFQKISVVVTATEWDNFFELRDHEAAQPEIRDLAVQMRLAYERSKPQRVYKGDWHLPYIRDYEKGVHDIQTLLKICTARCARVSYLNHDGEPSPVGDDIRLHDQLVVSAPPHMSPAEHPARCNDSMSFDKQYKGWSMYRSFLEKKIPVMVGSLV